MAKKRSVEQQITDEEILSMGNVPVVIAAKYLHQSTATIYLALKNGNAPYGYATAPNDQGEATQYTYHISPGLLVAYERGTLPLFPVAPLVSME